jgi:hypothetical protein
MALLSFVFLVSHPFSFSSLNGPFLFEYSLIPTHNFLYKLSLTTSNLKTEAVCSSETPVTTYKATQHHYQEDTQPMSSPTWEPHTDS